MTSRGPQPVTEQTPADADDQLPDAPVKQGNGEELDAPEPEGDKHLQDEVQESARRERDALDGEPTQRMNPDLANRLEEAGTKAPGITVNRREVDDVVRSASVSGNTIQLVAADGKRDDLITLLQGLDPQDFSIRIDGVDGSFHAEALPDHGGTQLLRGLSFDDRVPFVAVVQLAEPVVEVKA